MKKAFAFIITAFLILSTFNSLKPAAQTGALTPEKLYYNDFENGISENEALPTGNGDNTSYILHSEGAEYSCSDGALHIKLTNGNYLWLQNSMTGIENYKYMVVRVKGTTDWGEGLDGNSLCFWFGSFSTPGEKIYMHSEHLTDEYSNVVFEIKDSYFNEIADDYKSSLFITTERGAHFDIYIDEIYFYGKNEEYSGVFADLNNDGDADIRDMINIKKQFASGGFISLYDIDRNGSVDSADLAFMRKFLLGACGSDDTGKIYSDFSTEIVEGEYVASGEKDGKIQLFYTEFCEYETKNGFFNLNFHGTDSYVRFINTLQLCDKENLPLYKYMVLTLKVSSAENNRSSNLLKLWFGSWANEKNAFYISSDSINENLYTKIVIPLNASYFSDVPADYNSGIFIKSAFKDDLSVSVDEIRFCFTAPSDPGITSGNADVYNFSDEIPSSDYCSVTVNGTPCYVYETETNSRRVSPSGNSNDILDISMCEVVSFDMSGNVTLEIRLNNIKLNSASVSPRSSGIKVTVADNTASFTISECGQYTVEFNGSTENALHIFANPYETDPIRGTSDDVIYFGPGVYDVGEITLESGQTLYIAGGAIVYGYAVSSGDNISIRGRGYLDGSVYPRYASDGVSSAHKTPVNLSGCDNVFIEGISCLDPSGWAYNLFNCSNTEIKNVKVITSRQNGDGISVQSCSDVKTSDSFFRTWDDSLVVKNYEGLSTSNIGFYSCIVWTDLAQSMEIGYETRGDYITGVTFKDITVLHNFHKAIISIHNGDHADISDILFSDIVVEDAQMGSGDGLNYLIDFQVLYSPIWSTENTRGSIKNIKVHNVNVLKGNYPKIRITGYDSAHTVSDVLLSNINIFGKAPDYSDTNFFITNKYVTGIEFSTN